MQKENNGAWSGLILPVINCIGVAIYLGIATLGVLEFFSTAPDAAWAPIGLWLVFVFSAPVTLTFAAIGIFSAVWGKAHRRFNLIAAVLLLCTGVLFLILIFYLSRIY